MNEITLPPAELRRLARLHARAEGALMVSQAAEQAAKQAQATVQQTLTEMCEEQGMRLPQTEQGTQVDIDWRAGTVRLGEQAQASNGVAPPPGPVDQTAGSAF